IVVSDHLAIQFEFSTDRSASFGGCFGQRECWQHTDEFMQLLNRSNPLFAFRRPVEQLSIGNDRKDSFSWTQLAKSAQHFFRPFLPNVNANICVQQISRLHYSTLRSCGWSLSRSAST